MHENREISSTPWSCDQGRSGKATSRTADMYAPEKSDCAVGSAQFAADPHPLSQAKDTTH